MERSGSPRFGCFSQWALETELAGTKLQGWSLEVGHSYEPVSSKLEVLGLEDSDRGCQIRYLWCPGQDTSAAANAADISNLKDELCSETAWPEQASNKLTLNSTYCWDAAVGRQSGFVFVYICPAVEDLDNYQNVGLLFLMDL